MKNANQIFLNNIIAAVQVCDESPDVETLPDYIEILAKAQEEIARRIAVAAGRIICESQPPHEPTRAEQVDMLNLAIQFK